MPHIAGGSIRFNSHLTDIQIEINGKPIEHGRSYIVAATDLEFSEIINYLVIPDEQIEFEVPTIVPEVLQDYIRRHSPVRQPDAKRLLAAEK
jgi:hypothetical protein